jgi:hypothetical protein
MAWVSMGGGWGGIRPFSIAQRVGNTYDKAGQEVLLAQIIIPGHYASLPVLSTETKVRAAIEKDRRMQFMKPGQKKIF